MGKHPPPLLLTTHDDEYENQSFYNLLDDCSKTTSYHVMHSKLVLDSAYGWLVLINIVTNEWCLFNPASMEVIQVQLEINHISMYNRCIFSKPQTELGCFIVFTQTISMKQIVCRIGDHMSFYVHSEEEEGYCLIAMASFRGVIYGITNLGYEFEHEFVTINMVRDTLETTSLLIDGEHCWEVPQPRMLSRSTVNRNYLIELPCGNELLLVTKTFFPHCTNFDNVLRFRVFRVNVDKKVLEEVENIDGKTIFISDIGNGFCRYSECFGTAFKPNSIYYTNGMGSTIFNGSVMNVYDMDDMSTTTLLPRSSSEIDLATSSSYWVDLKESSIYED